MTQQGLMNRYNTIQIKSDTHSHLFGAVGGEGGLILQEDAEEGLPGDEGNLLWPLGVAGPVVVPHLALCGQQQHLVIPTILS